jgi:signal transduction histidine kinase
MRLQDLKHLDAAMEAFTACIDVDMLFGTLFVHTRDLFHMEAAFVWLTVDAEQSRLYRTEGVPAPIAAGLQRLKISASGERTIAKRLHQLGYRTVLAAPLRVHGKMVGMVAVGSPHSRRSHRIEATIFHLLVQYAMSTLERWQFPPMLEGEEAPRPMTSAGDLDVQYARTHLLNLFISGITHDLNNAMAAISGRVELLLHRLHDQVALRHLMEAQHAIIEASQMIRHIHGFMSGDHEDGVVMVDINQLVRDSLQIARSTWFQGFRQRHMPIDLGADLHPVPALPSKASDLRIALLCLLRHAMDTLRPGGGLIVRTSSVGDGEGQVVMVSLSDAPGQPSTTAHEGGIGILLSQAHTPESQLALQFVQAIVHNLDGQITVERSADGGTATTLILSASRMVAGEH